MNAAGTNVHINSNYIARFPMISEVFAEVYLKGYPRNHFPEDTPIVARMDSNVPYL
jgi:hypothetical protein